MASVRILDAAATADALPYGDVVAEIHNILASTRAGRTTCPARTVVPVGTGAHFGADAAGLLLTMVAADDDYAIVKIVSVHPDSAPSVKGDVIVTRVASGERLLFLDGTVVTARRTAAVSVAAVQKLRPQFSRRSRSDPLKLLIIGTGAQAMSHKAAFESCWGESSVVVKQIGRTLAAVEGNGDSKANHAEKTFVVDMAELSWADVVVTATSSRTPVFSGAASLHIRNEAIVCAIGVFTADAAELPAELVARSRSCLCVDDRAGAVSEAGDFLLAGVEVSNVVPLADVLEGATCEAPAVFKSVGCALWDLAAARCAVSKLR